MLLSSGSKRVGRAGALAVEANQVGNKLLLSLAEADQPVGLQDVVAVAIVIASALVLGATLPRGPAET